MNYLSPCKRNKMLELGSVKGSLGGPKELGAVHIPLTGSSVDISSVSRRKIMEREMMKFIYFF